MKKDCISQRLYN